MAKRLAKRFYKRVSVEKSADRWVVLLDGMQLRTPGKQKLDLPTEGLAQKVATEWDAQTDRINPSIMPVTRLVNVAFEQTPLRRNELIDEAERYVRTDLICYRAEQPRILLERQAKAWDVWRDWGETQGIKLQVTHTLSAIDQADKSIKRVRAYAASLDDIALTLFVHLVAVYGSVILAMAVMRGEVTADQAFDLSRIEQTYQIELWGEDEEQAEIDAALRAETTLLGKLLENLNG